jgi:hypothetical protein
MTALPPSEPPALATIDLSGGDETPGAAAGRIIGGLLTMIIGGVLAIGLFAAALFGWLVPALADWVDFLGDFLLFGAAIAAGVAITGFTILRRGRKVRAQDAAQSAAMMQKLQAAGALDGSATPDEIMSALQEEGPRTGDMDISMQRPLPGTPGPASTTGGETHL